VLQSARSVAVGVMLGIDPAQKDPLTPYLVNVKQTDLQPGKYNVILGEQLAGQLGVNRGDQIRVMVPSASQFTPMGRLPSQRLFTVIGTFAANSEVDGYQMLTNIQDASRLMRYPVGNITGWRLWLNEPLKVDTLSQQTLPQGTKWQDWRERKGELFQAVRMEKNMMGLLLSLIVAVAAFNIITSLGLMVMEKQGEVAILQTQGLTPRQIMMVFMVQGASAGIIGALLGAVLGALLASPYPADVGGHARFGPETLDQALEQRGQIHLIDGGLREQITDASQRPGRRVSHHHTGVLHQLNEGRHGLTTHP